MSALHAPFLPLSTKSFPWNNGVSKCDHKPVVYDGAATVETVSERLAFVMQTCGCPEARFHEWIGVATRSVWQNWRVRNEFPKNGARKVSEASGASVEWLMWNTGSPFPDGPKRYTGPRATDDVADLKRQLASLYAALGSVVSVFSARLPGAAGELERALAPLRSMPGVEVLAAAAEEARRGEEQAARSVARKGSAGKPHGRGR